MATMEYPRMSPLDKGNVKRHVDDSLFKGKIDSLDPHIERKKALADPVRYSILYLLYEYGQVSRKRLRAETGRKHNQLQHHMKKLLETSLIAEIPAPDESDGRRTYYRITILGKQEIASDLKNIMGGTVYKDWFEIFGDPELVDTMPSENGRERVRNAEIDSKESEAAKINAGEDAAGRQYNQRATVWDRQENDLRDTPEPDSAVTTITVEP